MIRRLMQETPGAYGRCWNRIASETRARAGGHTHAVASVYRRMGLLVLAAALGLAIPAVADASAQTAAVPAYTMTPRRAGASLAVVAALIGAVIGGHALSRAAGKSNSRRGAIAALVLGPAGLAGGGLVVATAQGSLGTGNGLGGGVIAMVAGLTGLTLGWLALARSRRAA